MITHSSEFARKLAKPVKHKLNVLNNCIELADKLVEIGENELARELVVNGFTHDLSKFEDEEFEILADPTACPEQLRQVSKKHAKRKRNKHHPDSDFWGGSIHRMTRLYVAEMVCDWKARSNEFGSSLREWIDGPAAERFKFTKEDPIYKEIMFFVDLLCDKPFASLGDVNAATAEAKTV
jgi:hypothetical protein